MTLGHGTAWNEGLIKSIFGEEEAKAIFSIPLEKSNREDKLIWTLTKNGIFIIKITYFVALKQQSESRGTSSKLDLSKTL